MFAKRPADVSCDSHPASNRVDFPEGHSCLCHAKRTRVHSQKDHAPSSAAKFPEIRFMRRPCVIERIIDEFDGDRKSTRLNSSHSSISYAVFCLKKKKKTIHE